MEQQHYSLADKVIATNGKKWGGSTSDNRQILGASDDVSHQVLAEALGFYMLVKNGFPYFYDQPATTILELATEWLTHTKHEDTRKLLPHLRPTVVPQLWKEIVEAANILLDKQEILAHVSVPRKPSALKKI